MTFLEEKPNGENSNRSTFERLKKGRFQSFLTSLDKTNASCSLVK